MTKQRTPSRSLKSIGGAALAGLGLFVLSGNLDAAAAQLGDLLRPGPLQVLVSFWPALLSIIGAA